MNHKLPFSDSNISFPHTVAFSSVSLCTFHSPKIIFDTMNEVIIRLTGQWMLNRVSAFNCHVSRHFWSTVLTCPYHIVVIQTYFYCRLFNLYSRIDRHNLRKYQFKLQLHRKLISRISSVLNTTYMGRVEKIKSNVPHEEIDTRSTDHIKENLLTHVAKRLVQLSIFI